MTKTSFRNLGSGFIATLIIFIVGVILGIVGVVLCVNHYKKLSTYMQVEGVVVDYDERRDYDDDDGYYYVYAPIAEYIVDGQTYHVTDSSYTNVPKAKGTKVTILYNPNNPADAVFKSDSAIIAVPIVACFFMLVGGASLILNIKNSKRRAATQQFNGIN